MNPMTAPPLTDPAAIPALAGLLAGELPKTALVPLARMVPDPDNRPDGSAYEGLEELAQTIRLLGVLQPVVIVPHETRGGYFRIRAGERRWRASQIAGLTKIPAIVRTDLRGPALAALTQIIENGCRVGHGPVELALAFGKLLDAGMTQADIARVTPYSPSTVSYHVELLDADEKTLDLVRRGTLKVGAVHDAVKTAGPGRSGTSGTRPASRRPGGRRGPVHFTATHPLAGAASSRCAGAGHPARDRYGKVACLPCWEQTVRDDAVNAGGRPLAQGSAGGQ